MKEKLDQVILTLAVMTGVLTLVTKSHDLFLSFYWAPETLLGVSVIGLMLFSSRLVWAKKIKRGFPSPTIAPLHSKSIRYSGVVLLIVAPLAGLIIWYSALRIPPTTQQEIKSLETAGDISVETNQPIKAKEYYKQALDKDPRRTDIRIKYEKLDGRTTGEKK